MVFGNRNRNNVLKHAITLLVLQTSLATVHFMHVPDNNASCISALCGIGFVRCQLLPRCQLEVSRIINPSEHIGDDQDPTAAAEAEALMQCVAAASFTTCQLSQDASIIADFSNFEQTSCITQNCQDASINCLYDDECRAFIANSLTLEIFPLLPNGNIMRLLACTYQACFSSLENASALLDYLTLVNNSNASKLIHDTFPEIGAIRLTGEGSTTASHSMGENVDAGVGCRQLGFASGVGLTVQLPSSSISAPYIATDSFFCSGSEEHLLNCPFTTGDQELAFACQSNNTVAALFCDFCGVAFNHSFYCAFRGLDAFPASLSSNGSGNPGVVEVHLLHNNIPSVPREAFVHIPSTTVIDLSHNAITQIAHYAFVGIPHLYSLNLANNKLLFWDVSVLFPLSFPALEHVLLAENGLTSIGYAAFSGAPNLRVLDLSNNAVSRLHGNEFTGLSLLHTLDLSNNVISAIPRNALGALVDLRTLHLDQNAITYIAAGAFAANAALREVHLGFNRLAHVCRSWFQASPTVESLLLNHNLVTFFPLNFFYGMDSLRLLNVRENPVRNMRATDWHTALRDVATHPGVHIDLPAGCRFSGGGDHAEVRCFAVHEYEYVDVHQADHFSCERFPREALASSTGPTFKLKDVICTQVVNITRVSRVVEPSDQPVRFEVNTLLRAHAIDVFVNKNTGEILCFPREVGRFVVQLYVVEPYDGFRVPLDTFTFEVELRPVLAVGGYDFDGDIGVDDVISNLKAIPLRRLAVGRTYHFPPVVLYNLTLPPQTDVSFTIDNAPPGLYINPTNGQMVCSPFRPGVWTVHLYVVALHANGAIMERLALQQMRFDFLTDDPDTAAYGPNGQPCANGGVAVDEVEFDASFSCDCAATRYGGDNCNELKVSTGTSSSLSKREVALYFILFIGCLILAAVVMYCSVRAYRRRIRRAPYDFRPSLASLAGEMMTPASGGRVRIPCELRRSDVTLLDKIDEGEFGEVFLGLYSNSTALNGTSARCDNHLRVAVKVSKHPTTTTDQPYPPAVLEAAIMAQFDHDNILQLVGVVSRDQQLLLVMPFCTYGSLCALLRQQDLRNQESISLLTAMQIACDILSALEYLETRSFMHRDIATRNVLVNGDYTYKLADFGMSRHVGLSVKKNYYRMKSGFRMIPLRWTAPEVLLYGKFSAASDMWSFGILMYEVFTRAALPYDGLSDVEVNSGVRGPLRLQCPFPAAWYPPWVFGVVMRDLWRADPQRRPTARDVRCTIAKLVPEACTAHARRCFSSQQNDRVSVGLRSPSDGQMSGLLTVTAEYSIGRGVDTHGAAGANSDNGSDTDTPALATPCIQPCAQRVAPYTVVALCAPSLPSGPAEAAGAIPPHARAHGHPRERSGTDQQTCQPCDTVSMAGMGLATRRARTAACGARNGVSHASKAGLPRVHPQDGVAQGYRTLGDPEVFDEFGATSDHIVESKLL